MSSGVVAVGTCSTGKGCLSTGMRSMCSSGKELVGHLVGGGSRVLCGCRCSSGSGLVCRRRCSTCSVRPEVCSFRGCRGACSSGKRLVSILECAKDCGEGVHLRGHESLIAVKRGTVGVREGSCAVDNGTDCGCSAGNG